MWLSAGIALVTAAFAFAWLPRRRDDGAEVVDRTEAIDVDRLAEPALVVLTSPESTQGPGPIGPGAPARPLLVEGPARRLPWQVNAVFAAPLVRTRRSEPSAAA